MDFDKMVTDVSRRILNGESVQAGEVWVVEMALRLEQVKADRRRDDLMVQQIDVLSHIANSLIHATSTTKFGN